MNATLHVLAEIYRESSAARSGAVKDYTLDWEKFLRRADLHDGDSRELAEGDLLDAEKSSGGAFVIDRHPRSGAKQVLRLKRDGGEAWLFSTIGLSSPAEEREKLASFFGQAASSHKPAEHAAGWSDWFSALAVRAREGGTVLPFSREDAAGNLFLLEALAGVLTWRGESLVRYASAVICRDSKALETLRPRLLAAVQEITGRPGISLEEFGITDKPRSALIHGPLVLDLPGGRIDFGILSGPVAVSSLDLAAAGEISCHAPLVLTVENESVFLELAKCRTGALLVHTSFPGAAVRLLLEKLPRHLHFYHFGDSDPAGFDILRDLREKTGISFQPLRMRFRHGVRDTPLTAEEQKTITRLLASPLVADIHGELKIMRDAATKGNFEQETLPLGEVVDQIAKLSRSPDVHR